MSGPCPESDRMTSVSRWAESRGTRPRALQMVSGDAAAAAVLRLTLARQTDRQSFLFPSLVRLDKKPIFLSIPSPRSATADFDHVARRVAMHHQFHHPSSLHSVGDRSSFDVASPEDLPQNRLQQRSKSIPTHVTLDRLEICAS